MRIILQGNDHFRIHERLHKLREAFRAKFDPNNYTATTIDFTDATIQDLHAALQQSGLFTKKRFVVVYNLETIKALDQANAVQQLTQIGEDVIAVIVVPAINDLPVAVAEPLAQDSKIESFPELSPAEVIQWVTRRFAAVQRKIPPAAVQYLVQAHGTDLWALNSVVQQLIHTKPDISIELVQQYVASPLDDNIFHLSDALATKQTKRALQLLHDQFRAGASPFYLLTMLARQIELLIQAKEGSFATNVSPYARTKAREHAKRFSVVHLKELHTGLTEIDYQMKTTALDPVLLLDRWVVAATLAEHK